MKVKQDRQIYLSIETLTLTEKYSQNLAADAPSQNSDHYF